MLTREVTMRLVDQMRKQGYGADEVAKSRDNRKIISFYPDENIDIARRAAEWVARRGNTDEALENFVEMFHFNERDVAIAKARIANSAGVLPGCRARDDASVAATLVNNWLNTAARQTGSSGIEYEYIQMMLERSERRELALRVARTLFGATLLGVAMAGLAMAFSHIGPLVAKLF